MASLELVPGVVALLASWAMAFYVRATRPSATQNRRLARALWLLGLSAAMFPVTFALVANQDGFEGLGLILFGLVVFVVVTYLLVAEWLGIAATMATPLARPLRRWFVRYGAVLAAVVLGALVAGATGNEASGLLVALVVPAYCVAVAASAYRRATPGSPEGARVRAFAVAFGVLVGAFLLLGLSLTFLRGDAVDHLLLWVWPLAAVVFVALATYGQLNPQRFDLPLKVKVGIRRSTLLGIVATAMLAVFGVVQQLSEAKIGLLATVLVPALLFPLRKRLEGIADRVSDRALPDVKDTPEYRAMRKILVYRSAVESAMRDGLTESEASMLAMLREELALPAEVSAQVERDAKPPPPAAPAPAG